MVEYKGTPFKDIANLKIELNTSHVTVKSSCAYDVASSPSELNTSHVTVKLPVIYTFLIYIIYMNVEIPIIIRKISNRSAKNKYWTKKYSHPLK